ncbi:hypothetical protein AK812_SmicGene18843 [Symbiodinium microadriaticum]|uniref:Uncharacterized protein n=1 Tax=Symbiodinium microadriaticum TaxID=2951 RepID=A0A1Q9DU15_SYMMI|nr:hypothetical protein AK812_SmicGene18843 [Symbiodinium microadriaticum]
MKSGVSCNMLQRQELSSLEVAPMLLALRLDFAAQRRCLAEQTCQGPSASKNQVLSFSPSDRPRSDLLKGEKCVVEASDAGGCGELWFYGLAFNLQFRSILQRKLYAMPRNEAGQQEFEKDMDKFAPRFVQSLRATLNFYIWLMMLMAMIVMTTVGVGVVVTIMLLALVAMSARMRPEGICQDEAEFLYLLLSILLDVALIACEQLLVLTACLGV